MNLEEENLSLRTKVEKLEAALSICRSVLRLHKAGFDVDALVAFSKGHPVLFLGDTFSLGMLEINGGKNMVHTYSMVIDNWQIEMRSDKHNRLSAHVTIEATPITEVTAKVVIDAQYGAVKK